MPNYIKAKILEQEGKQRIPVRGCCPLEKLYRGGIL